MKKGVSSSISLIGQVYNSHQFPVNDMFVCRIMVQLVERDLLFFHLGKIWRYSSLK